MLSDEVIAKINESVATIDEKCNGAFQLGRTDDGQWVIRLDGDSSAITAASLGELLDKAVAYKVPKAIPRRPLLYTEADMTFTKTSGAWRLTFSNGSSAGYRTYEEAMRIARFYIENSKQKCEEWDEKYSQLVASGIEGVDYRYL